MTLTDRDKGILGAIAAKLAVPVEWLSSLIRFESRFNPSARNPISGARGLIQFTNTTARAMGYGSADDLLARHPTIESQLTGPVLAYLSKLAPFPSEQSLYMAVFYPAARNWPLSQPFPPAVQAVNPGIVTVADYVSKVKGTKIKLAIGGAILLAVVGSALWWLYSHPQTAKELHLWPATVPKKDPPGMITPAPEHYPQA